MTSSSATALAVRLILSSAGDQTRWLTLVFAGLVGGCVLAFIFAAYTYQPVYNLLRRLPGTVQSKNAYADIASSIDSMTYKLNKARKEESLRRRDHSNCHPRFAHQCSALYRYTPSAA